MRRTTLAMFLPLMLAACTGQDHLGPNFGDAVIHNRVAHIIDPNPVYPGPVLLDGARGALALERYQTGKVIEPLDLRTSTFGQQSN